MFWAQTKNTSTKATHLLQESSQVWIEIYEPRQIDYVVRRQFVAVEQKSYTLPATF
jgi:hypothetical protein